MARGFRSDRKLTPLFTRQQLNATTGALYLDDWDIHEGEMAKLARIVGNCSSADRDAYARCILDEAGAAVQR